jgi:hypothetical protein
MLTSDHSATATMDVGKWLLFKAAVSSKEALGQEMK